MRLLFQKPALSNAMALSHEDVCGMVRKLWDSINLPSGELMGPVSVRNTLIPQVALLKQIGGKPFPIETLNKGWGHASLAGLLLRYPDEAQILYSVNLNLCWARFVICKELAHLVIDTDAKHFTHDPQGLVQQLIIGAPTLNSTDPVRSEQLAAFAAVEMLLPWSVRPCIRKMKDEKATDLEIAQRFSVPQQVVNYLVNTAYWDESEKHHLKYSVSKSVVS
jgi:Zn-dependent peptidase ImmA (M78 family)